MTLLSDVNEADAPEISIAQAWAPPPRQIQSCEVDTKSARAQSADSLFRSPPCADVVNFINVSLLTRWRDTTERMRYWWQTCNSTDSTNRFLLSTRALAVTEAEELLQKSRHIIELFVLIAFWILATLSGDNIRRSRLIRRHQLCLNRLIHAYLFARH